MSALTSPTSVEFRILDDTPGSGLSEADAYALLAGIITPGQLAARGLLVASAEEAKRTGGMIALVPSDADVERLTVNGGESADELHLTLAFLGDDVTQLDPEVHEKIVEVARRYAGGAIDAEAFAVNIFNPNKIDSDGSPGGCVVLGVGRSDGLIELRSNIVSALGGLGGLELPEQHEPWVPHITLKYTNDFSDVGSLTDRVGPVTFDRLRVALGPNVVDIPLKEDDMSDTVTASSAVEFTKERDVNAPGGGHNLRNYWVRGPGAAKIGWGTDGSFKRCVAQLSDKVKNPEGLCAEYHKAATGEWPAEEGVESAVTITETAAGGTGGAPAPAKNKNVECPSGYHRMPDGTCMSDADMYDYVLRAKFGTSLETLAAGTATAAPADAPVADGSGDAPWEGVLVVEGIESGDSRLFNLGSLDWADLPLPLQYQPANIGGHNGSVTVGEITHLARKKNQVYGWGNIFGTALTSEHGDGIRNNMRVGGVSVDVDKVKDADVELIYPEAAADGGGGIFAKPELTIFNRGRIRGATLVAFPAFVEAKLKLTTAEAVTTASADCGCDQDQNTDTDTDAIVVAAAHTITIPDLPPAHWFNEPTDVQLNGALTITDEGRVFGIVAPAGTTHRNHPVTVPRNLDFSRFHKGETIVEGGNRVVTGVITADCGHAPVNDYGTLSRRIQHYDNSCSVLANVRVGYGKDGHIWAAGALNAGATPGQVAQALGCGLSLDVQPNPDRPGTREFIAAHLVPVTGFPLARTSASVSYEDGVIVAATVPVVHANPPRTRYPFTTDVVTLAKKALAMRIGLDPVTVKKNLSERLGI